jgi:hypothetical protein
MKITLRQTGGIVGLDDRVELDDAELTVASVGGEPRRRSLAPDELAHLHEAVERLLAQAPAVLPPLASDAVVASDSMLTELTIGPNRRAHRFRIRSGDEAPAELWDLVDALTDATKPR